MELATLQRLLTDSFSDYKRRSSPLDAVNMREAILNIYQKYNYFVADFAHFELPEELVLLANETDETESQDLSDGTWWSLLSCWEQMLTDLDYELSNFDLESVQKYYEQPYYFFVPVGFWSDKHVYFISCDRRYHFGAFFDCHDSYMWDKNNDLIANNLADFLKSEFPKKANHKLTQNSPNSQYEEIIAQLSAQKYAIVDNFISAEITAHLRQSSEYKFAQRLFKQAGVGNAGKFQLNADIRRDKILWLDPESDNLTTAERFFCDKIADFIQYLNQTCFLGLKSYELHYARYEKGDYYQRHLDQFQQNGSRKLSLICYLNPIWQPEDAGELRIELENDNFTDLAPLAGRLVVFWSDEIWHEVLPTQQLRHSLTGWLKT